MAKIIQFPKPKTAENVISLETYKQHKSVFELSDQRRKLLEMQKELERIRRSLLLRMVKDGDDQG